MKSYASYPLGTNTASLAIIGMKCVLRLTKK